jgi:hypothetical protein
MGTHVSADKHVTGLEDLLAYSTNQYLKVKPEFDKLESRTDTHLRLWKCYEDATETTKT